MGREPRPSSRWCNGPLKPELEPAQHYRRLRTLLLLPSIATCRKRFIRQRPKTILLRVKHRIQLIAKRLPVRRFITLFPLTTLELGFPGSVPILVVQLCARNVDIFKTLRWHTTPKWSVGARKARIQVSRRQQHMSRPRVLTGPLANRPDM